MMLDKTHPTGKRRNIIAAPQKIPRQHAAEQQAKTGQVKHLTMMGHASDPQ
jgi:hypothetical protein